MSSGTPDGYVRRVQDGADLLLRSGLEDALLAAGIARPDELVTRAPAKGLKGRGALALLEIEARDARPGVRAVVRPYRRGGLLGKIVRRLSLDRERARNELALHAEARAKGAPVVEALAAVTWRSGIGFHHALATRAIDGANDLEAVLKASRGRERRRSLAAAGDAVRGLHEAGFDHADLNLKNVLVCAGEPARGLVLDLDGGRMAHPLAAEDRRRSLVRLLRSFYKLALKDPAAVSASDPFRFARAYARGNRTVKREVVLWGRQALGWIRARAVVWRLLGLVGRG